MKSVIQEASSLMKAIEKGWEKAGSPHEFTVKILEESERNFIGLTTKQAKVCILFAQTGHSQRPQSHHAASPKQQQPQRPQQPRAPRVQQPQEGAQAAPSEQQPGEQQKRRPRRRYYHRRPKTGNDSSSNGQSTNSGS